MGEDGIEVLTHLGQRRAVVAVELEQLGQDRVTLLTARLREQGPASDEGVGQAAEVLGDLDPNPARVFAGALPGGGLSSEVVVAVDEVVGGLPEHGAETAMAAAAQGAAGAIDPVALVAAGHQTGASGDRGGVGLEGDRPEFAAEVGDGDDVDARDDQQEDGGRGDDAVGQRAFQGLELPGLCAALVVVGGED